jgi:DNA invertase Pin-like site-specific DNA recombinase
VLIGYARISTDDQNLALQHDALTATGCEKIYEDRISGARAERPGLTLALEVAQVGDTVIVWRLDRLGRSLKDLITLAERFEQRQFDLNRLLTKSGSADSFRL